MAAAEETTLAPVGEIILPEKKSEQTQLFVPNGLDKFIIAIREELKKYPQDVTTEKGRKQIASLARKVASSKVKLDEVGKVIVAEIKLQAVGIDAERKRMREEMDKIRDEYRAPLTKYEEMEEVRVKGHQDALVALEKLKDIPLGASVATVESLFTHFYALNERDWEEFDDKASVQLLVVTDRLHTAMSAAKEYEKEQEELARLRAAEQERIAKEREEQIKAEAAAEATRQAEAKAAEEKAASERAVAEAEAKAKRLQEAADNALKAAEESVARERERVAAEKKAEEEETAKRESNRAHKAKVNGAVVGALVALAPQAIDQDTARKIVTAIAKGEIPNLKIAY